MSVRSVLTVVCCVPCAVLGLATVARAQPALDSEFLIDTSGVQEQGTPAVASDGENFLVVWHESRSGSSDIYGARVTRQGTVIDPVGFVISQAADDQCNAVVGYNGTDYLVVWEDYRGGVYDDIYGARVTAEGRVLDPDGIAICTGWRYQICTSLACGSSNSLVTWFDPAQLCVYGARVTAQGAVLDPAGILISTWSSGEPTVAFGGDNFLVVWCSTVGLLGARVTPGGTVLDPQGILMRRSAVGDVSPALAFGGTSFLLVWHQYGGNERDIFGCRVTPDGVVLDPSAISIAVAPGRQEVPAVSYDAANFLVVWQDFRCGDSSDVYGARVSPQGIAFGEGPAVEQDWDQRSPALARSSGSQMILVYRVGPVRSVARPTTPGVYGAR